eukprot:471317-Prymnesium_polylepis.1
MLPKPQRPGPRLYAPHARLSSSQGALGLDSCLPTTSTGPGASATRWRPRYWTNLAMHSHPCRAPPRGCPVQRLQLPRILPRGECGPNGGGDS